MNKYKKKYKKLMEALRALLDRKDIDSEKKIKILENLVCILEIKDLLGE